MIDRECQLYYRIIDKNPVIGYLDNIVRVKVDKVNGTKRIWYLGTDGRRGHYPKCINGFMTSDECSKLRNADSESFEKIVCSDYKVFCVRDSLFC